MFKKLNVLGKDYKISKKLSPDLAIQINEDDFMGLCMDDRGEIFINKAYKHGEKYWATLFHELGHATMYRNGIRNSSLVPIELEEIIVETMASVQYSTTREILKKVVKLGDIDLISDFVEKF